MTPLSITDQNCDAVTGLAPRAWRKALVAMQVHRAKVGRKTICRSDDWLAAISRRAGTAPLVGPGANPTAMPPQPTPVKSQAESEREWMQRVLLPALAEQQRRRRERAAREADVAVVALDTLLIENFEVNGLTLTTLQKWTRLGRLPSQKVGRTTKVLRSDVAPLLAEWKRSVRR